MLKHILITAMIAFTVTVAKAKAEEGHVVGNAGGVICIAGKCKTLTEAGLRLSPSAGFDGGWLPGPELIFETDLVSRLVLPQQARDMVQLKTFGRMDHFRKVDVIDPQRLADLKQRYVDVANEAGITVDPATLQIVAVSSDDTVTPALTYLLPRFFELTPEQQIQVLLHEGLYRGRSSKDLKYVLQFETTMADIKSRYEKDNIERAYGNCPLSQAATTDRTLAAAERKSCYDQLILAYRLGLMDQGQFLGALLTLSWNRFGNGTLTIQDLNSFGRWNADDSDLELSALKLLNLSRNDSRIPYILSKIDLVHFASTYSACTSMPGGTAVVLVVDWANDGTPNLCAYDKNSGWVKYQFRTQLNFVLPD